MQIYYTYRNRVKDKRNDFEIPAPLFSCEQVKNPGQFAMAILLVKADLHITNHENRSLKKSTFWSI